MDLPVMPPVKPMLAKPASGIPHPSGSTTYAYEPKWDGFRCIVFRDGDEVELGSRNERPLTRYFPEVVDAVRANLPERCVVDGEIVIVDATGDQLDFEMLLQRIHPADSRVRMLAREHPARFIAFDLLAVGDEDLMGAPQADRRARLESALRDAQPPIHVTPVTRDPEIAARWFDVFEGAGLDGLIAKPESGTYEPDKRVLAKIKHERTADCVVAGYRWHKSGPVVGSLLLGLYDEAGSLQHVGVIGAFPAARRAALVEELAPYAMDELSDHPWSAWASEDRGADRLPGAVSRWNAKKDLSWVAIRPELVVEVAYDHMEGTRFRHTAQFRRWRPDREPVSCTYEQLEQPVRYDLADVLNGGPIT